MRRAASHLLRAALVALALLPTACGTDGGTAPIPHEATYDEAGALLGREAPSGARPNVLLVVLDTLRADALDLDGETGGSMPRLAARARRGVACDQATAASSWTLPSLTSLLTARLPSDHGVLGLDGLASGLAPLPTWAEILRASLGYETLAWVAGPWSGGPGRMLEGFESVIPNASLQAAPLLVTQWSRQRDPRRPYFALLHSFEAHDPYGAANHSFPPRPHTPEALAAVRARLGPDPAPADLVRAFTLDRAGRDTILDGAASPGLMQRFLHAIGPGYRAAPDPALAGELRQAYEAGTRWVDGLLEQALAAFEGAGLLRNTLVIVVGDHGEAFGEHGMLMHGRQLYDELVHVPLVLQGPAPFDGGRRIPSAVGLVDVLPTVLDWLHLPPPPASAGRSLLPLLQGQAAEVPVVSQVATTREQTAGTSEARVESVRSRRWKYILTYERLAGTVVEEAYDLQADPEERENLADAHGRVTGVPFDEAFCAAVERTRDRIWGEVAGTRFLLEQGYAAGPAYVQGDRPAPACLSDAGR